MGQISVRVQTQEVEALLTDESEPAKASLLRTF